MEAPLQKILKMAWFFGKVDFIFHPLVHFLGETYLTSKIPELNKMFHHSSKLMVNNTTSEKIDMFDYCYLCPATADI